MKKMIKFYVRILFVLATLGLSSCGGDNDEPQTQKKELTISPTTLQYNSDGGFKVINLSVDSQTSWQTTNIPSWCTLTATSGAGNKSINVQVIANTLEDARTATITFSTENKSIDVNISQEGLVIVLAVTPNVIDFTVDGGTEEITINSGSSVAWEITNIPTWLSLSQTSGVGTQKIDATVAVNNKNVYRSATLNLETNSESLEIKVNQDYEGGLYPNYNINPIDADITGMSSTAEQIAATVDLGWNIGNSLEAIGSETAWGNPIVNKALIDAVKANGFNSIRIPCSWDQHMSNSETAEISVDWMNRVEEVVKYATDNDMTVLLNIHWDGGWLENNIVEDQKESINAKQKAFWQQIATHFRDYDEKLMFASANEPHVENATAMSLLTSFHQTFIDAVRATGGKNAYRTLVVQGPKTDIHLTNELMNTLPTDTVEDRMMVEIHYYTPYQFAGLTEDVDWGKMFFYWGDGYHSTTDTGRNTTWGEEAELANFFNLMKTKFIDKGIPVLLGEFGAIRRTYLTGENLQLHLDSRAYYLKSVVQQAKVYGLLPYYWDEGSIGNNGFGLFDRSNNTVFDTQALDALIEGSK